MNIKDFSYFSSRICECRTDYVNWNEIHKIFSDNIKLFDLAWETEINGKRYFFSHSGVRKEWLMNWVISTKRFARQTDEPLMKWDDADKLPGAEYFNNMFHAAYDKEDSPTEWFFVRAIGAYSTYRGWDGWKYGSIVWSDIREWDEKEYDDVMFICGHTQLEENPIIMDYVADLDVRRPFVLDTETGKLEEYETRVDKED